MDGSAAKPPIHATNSQRGCGKSATALRPAIVHAVRRKANWRNGNERIFNICVLNTLTEHISGNILAHKALRTPPFCSAKRAILENKTARNGSQNGAFGKPKRRKAEDGGKEAGDSCIYASNGRSKKPHSHRNKTRIGQKDIHSKELKELSLHCVPLRS